MKLGKIGCRKMLHVWRNPYVTDGLVSMWDGEWNVGGGKHDADATTWADITGNGHDASVASGSFDDDGYDLSKRCYFTFDTALTEATIEIVGDFTTIANDRSGVFFEIPSSYIAFGRYNSKGIFSERNYLWTNSQFILPSPYPRSWVVEFISGANKEAWFDGVSPTRTTETWTTGGDSPCIGSRNDVGRIKSIRVYSRVLTADEIAANYAVDKERFGLTA